MSDPKPNQIESMDGQEDAAELSRDTQNKSLSPVPAQSAIEQTKMPEPPAGETRGQENPATEVMGVQTVLVIVGIGALYIYSGQFAVRRQWRLMAWILKDLRQQ